MYPWTDLAPEAVALAFGAFLAADGSFADAVTGAVAMGRDADTTAAIAGALAGAHGGLDGIPVDWRERIGPVTGRCLGEVVAGLHPLDLADRLAEHLERTHVNDRPDRIAGALLGLAIGDAAGWPRRQHRYCAAVDPPPAPRAGRVRRGPSG